MISFYFASAVPVLTAISSIVFHLVDGESSKWKHS